jgi:hypothetical protein
MKKIIFLGTVMLFVACSAVLTPELVIPGGYLQHEKTNLFPPEDENKVFVGKIVSCRLTKNVLHSNLINFIAINNGEILTNTPDKVIFSMSFPIGNETLNTPVGGFDRAQSIISFKGIVDIKDSSYRYSFDGFNLKRRKKISASSYVSYAPGIGFYTKASVDIKKISSEGTPNELHWNRMDYLTAERNGYVNLCVEEGKMRKKPKSGWVAKIKKMDSEIEVEKNLYEKEYRRILLLIEGMNKSMEKEDGF